MNNNNTSTDTKNNDWMNIVAWVLFGLAIILNGDLAIIGAILGYLYKRETGKKASMIANLVLIGLQVLYGFILGALWSLY